MPVDLPQLPSVDVPARVPNVLPVGPATVPIELAAIAVVLLGALALATGYLAARFYTSDRTVTGGLVAAGYYCTIPIRWPLALLRDGLVALLRRLVRRTGTTSYTARIATAVIILLSIVIALSGYQILTSRPEIGSSSAPVLVGFFELITNPWMYVVAALLFARGQLFFLDRMLAWRTARETGYGYRSVRRLAEEAKKPDLSACTRVIAQTGDDVHDLRMWILKAFDGDGHDAPDIGSDPDGQAQSTSTSTGQTGSTGQSDNETQEDLPLGAQFALARNDIAAALDIEHILWRFGVPFLVVLFAELIIVQIWVQWYIYPILFAVAGVAAAGYYWVTDLRYRRRLKGLRTEREHVGRTDCSILVKRVDLPETTMFYLFAGGRAYASRDRARLADVGAEVANDILEGRRPRPAIEERNAWLLQRYLPNLEKWTEQREKPQIADQLVETVTDAPEGVLPRSILATNVIEQGRGTWFWGLVPVGFGHDPDLVAEVYQDLTDPDVQALVEDPVEVDDVAGERVELPAVTRGDHRLTPQMLELRTEFSTWFQRAEQARYDLPGMDSSTDPVPYRRPETRRQEIGDTADGRGLGAGGAD